MSKQSPKTKVKVEKVEKVEKVVKDEIQYVDISEKAKQVIECILGKDEAKDFKVRKDAWDSTIASMPLPVLDTGSVLRGLKPEFMRACGRMYSNPDKAKILLAFIEQAREVAIAQIAKQTMRQEAKKCGR